MILLPSKRLAAAALGFTVAGCALSPATSAKRDPIDLVIAGGEIYDGTGSAGFDALIGINDGLIVFVGSTLPKDMIAEQTIDASGMIVAPGFIDPHTHEEDYLATGDPERQANLHYAFQGVSTVVVGNDGFGFPDFRAISDPYPAGTNYAFQSGFGDIRSSVMGMANRAPSSDELEEMKGLVRRDMCTGAIGFSTSLAYAPQTFSETGEVIELAKVASEFGGYYDTHLRDEGNFRLGIIAALDEAIAISKQADLPLHISHIKALGPEAWGKSAQVIQRIEAARAEGQAVTADQYPWSATGTRVSRALVPPWALEGGLKSLRERLQNDDLRTRIREGIVANIAGRGGADRLLVTEAINVSEDLVGQSLAALSDEQGIEPADVAIAILERGEARLASFSMREDDILALGSQDWVVTGSDGSTGHPRKYGSFPKAYRDWVVSGKMSLTNFIRRSSGQTADIIGLTDRGYLKPGFVADIVVLDPERFAPRATYQAPELLSAGVRYLVVNGSLVIDDEEYTGSLPGELLRKDTQC